MIKTRYPNYVTYASIYTGSEPIFYVCDINHMPITDLIEIMGKCYVNIIFNQYKVYSRFRPAGIPPVFVGLN